MISEVISASARQNLPTLITEAELKPEGHLVRLAVWELWLKNVRKSFRLAASWGDDGYDNDVIKLDRLET